MICSRLLLEFSKAKVILVEPCQEVESHRGQDEDQGNEEPGEDLQLAPGLMEELQLVHVAAAAIRQFRFNDGVAIGC